MIYALRKLIAFVFLGGIFWFIYQDLDNLDKPWFMHALGMITVAFAFFWLLIPMVVGPMIGNGINKAMNVKITDPGADIMTTEYIPAPEIFLAAAIAAVLMFVLIPILDKRAKKHGGAEGTK